MKIDLVLYDWEKGCLIYELTLLKRIRQLLQHK